MKDAVCCECQRTIAAGAYFSKKENAYIMASHPAINVQINVKDTSWKSEFVPSLHGNCRGVGTQPQYVFH